MRGGQALMSESKTEPRRSALRTNVRSIQITYLNFRSGNVGVVLDVSANGLGFRAVEPLETNELLSFGLSAPGFPHIQLSGQIAWLDESRKRGGLRLTVPVAERPAFQLWQQSQLETRQSTLSPRDADLASQRQPEKKESHTSRNVLSGCLMLVLCVALAEGPHLLAIARRVGDLLPHSGRTVSGATPPAASADLPQNTTRLAQSAPPGAAARAPHSRTKSSLPVRHHDAQLHAPTVSPSPARNPQTRRGPVGVARTTSADSVSSRTALRRTAKASAANANRALRGKGQGVDSRLRFFNARRAQSSARTSALEASRNSPEAPDTAAPSSPIVAEQVEPVKSDPGAAGSKAAFQSLSSAAEPKEEMHPQIPEAAAKLEPCQLVGSVQPTYPKQARKQRVEGDVKLRVVIGTDGAVRSVAPLDGPSLLVAAAIAAARQFHYKPALLNGKPIETIQTVDISFKLKR
ncbi:MAG: TonB family protein [Candidatus Acidiferrales bacterium]